MGISRHIEAEGPGQAEAKGGGQSARKGSQNGQWEVGFTCSEQD